jgi:hypothetical protein
MTIERNAHGKFITKEEARQRRRDELMAQIVADYDRRREHWWGRFLLWLLRKTT